VNTGYVTFATSETASGSLFPAKTSVKLEKIHHRFRKGSRVLRLFPVSVKEIIWFRGGFSGLWLAAGARGLFPDSTQPKSRL
ncbi:MAG: hypothetical protein KGI37_10855, partial [Alphaproteobacteria bacterium]|nr:hypothetical protein [Alphaproteobacteria bacterium]